MTIEQPGLMGTGTGNQEGISNQGDSLLFFPEDLLSAVCFCVLAVFPYSLFIWCKLLCSPAER